MSSLDSDSFSSDDQWRPRLETYAGRQLEPHRMRTNSHHEMTRVTLKHIPKSVPAIPVRVGAFTSTESVFSGYVPISNVDTQPIRRECEEPTKLPSERDSETGEAVQTLLTDGTGTNKDVSRSTETPPDRVEEAREGFGAWQVLVACTSTCILMGIDWVAFPVFYVHFAKEFGTSQLTTGWVGSLQNAVNHMFGIVFSAPIHIYGCKPVAAVGSLIAFCGLLASSAANSIGFLYMSFGIVSGIGLSMVTLPSFIIIQQHFHKNRSIATAISMCGVSCGQIIGPMLLQTLVDYFGWRGAMLLFAGITLHNLPISLLYCRARHEVRPSSSSSSSSKGIRHMVKHMIDFSLLRDPCFTLFCVGFFLVKFNIFGYYQHLPARMAHIGMGSRAAVVLLTVTGICSGTVRLLSGVIANWRCTNRVLMYSICVSIAGVVTALLPLAGPFWLTSVLCGVYGSCLGTTMLMVSIVLVDLLGVQNIARSRGIFNAFSGVAGLLTTPFSGFLFDVSNNYDLPFYVVGVMGVLGGLLSFVVYILNRNRKHVAGQVKDTC